MSKLLKAKRLPTVEALMVSTTHKTVAPVDIATDAYILCVPRFDILVEGTAEDWVVKATLMVGGIRDIFVTATSESKATIRLMKKLIKTGYLADIVVLSKKGG